MAPQIQKPLAGELRGSAAKVQSSPIDAPGAPPVWRERECALRALAQLDDEYGDGPFTLTSHAHIGIARRESNERSHP